MEKNFEESSDVKQIESVLAQMEEKRKASIIPAIWQGILLGAVLGAVIMLIVGDLIISMTVCIVCCVWGMFLYKRALLSKIYKNEIMPQLVATLGEGTKYSAQGGLTIETMHQCKLFAEKSGDRVSSEDCIKGVIGKTKFTFCESSYTTEEADLDSEDNSTKTETIFSGMGFEADFNKNFEGVTLLTNKRPSHLNKNEYAEVQLESVDFHKSFKVYSTDEIEARYILSTALQERLVKLVDLLSRNSGNKSVRVSFFQSRILILIESSENHFEASILKPLKLERVQQDFELLHTMGSIVDELNLNTRIWSKQ